MTALNVLFVEDNEDDARLILRALEEHGFDISSARVEAEEDLIAALGDGPWDLAILDQNLRGFSGQAVLSLLQERGFDGPMIIVSGAAGEQAAVRAMRAGAHDYVTKDNLARLGRAVKRELREAELRRQRREAQEALRASEARYRTLVETMGDGITMIDLDHRITYANESFAEMVGYRVDELVGMPLRDLYDEPGQRVLEEQLERRFIDGVSSEYEATIVNRRGREIPIITHASPIRDENGVITGSLAVIKDVTERREAQREREEALAQRALVMNSMSEMLALHDTDQRVVLANRTAAERVGMEPADMVGMPCHDLWHRADECWESCPVECTLEQGRACVGEYVDSDGRIMEVSSYPVRDENDALTGVVTLGKDVTEHRAAEEHARAGKERLRGVFDASPEGIVAADTDLRITDCNAALARMAGAASVDEVIGRSILDFVTDDSREAVIRNIRRMFEDGVPLRSVEYEGVTLDGRCFPIEVSGNALRDDAGEPVGIVAVVIDVSDRKEAERELQELAQFRRSIIDQANIWLHVLDRDLNVLVWNPAAEEITGISAERAMQSHRAWEVMHPDAEERRRIHQLAREIMEDGRVLENFEMTINTRDGEERTISWNARRLEGPDGEPIGLLALGRDVTEHREVEEQLRQAVKMEAIGRLAGGIAHDFNNMLTAILGNVQLLQMRMDPEDDNRRMLDEIRIAARRSAGLTRQLLAFSRKQAMEPEAVNLNTLAERLEPVLDRMLGEQIAFLTNLDPDVGTITADPSQIDQVLVNLAVNARDAMPDGGTITIETANVTLDEEAAVARANVEPGRYVTLTVTDTGKGMDRETLKRIFEPFFTTKGAEQGTGLGLPTVYGIVNQSGGHIQVHSEPDAGTVFRIYLPRTDAEETVAPDEEPGEEDLGGQETVLLVEDEKIVRDLVADVLERHGHRVITAESGEAALDCVGAYEGRIDIMVTDVVMPGISGVELADAIARSHPELPVLFVSGHVQKAVAGQEMSDEAMHYMQKPFDPEKLLRRMRALLTAQD